MPILKSALKKMRQSEAHRARNRQTREALKSVLDGFRKKPTPTGLSSVMSFLDKAAKTHVIHRNKAARLKSRLSKLLGKKAVFVEPTAKRKTRAKR